MRLFFDVADKKDRDQFVNAERLEPILERFFQLDHGETAELDIEKINLALAFVRVGFGYLSEPQQVNLPSYEEPVLNNAITLANELADRLAVKYHREKDRVIR